MKRLLSLILALTALLSLSACGLNSIPDGYTAKDEHFDPNGFQDSTDFCVYKYDSIDKLKSSEYFGRYKSVSEEDIENLKDYYENFEGWMETCNRLEEYSFDTDCISEGDYYRLLTKEGIKLSDGSSYGKYDNYTLYFFDTETLTLYYIHQNV